MSPTIQSDLLPRDARLAIVVSDFNEFITAKLLDGALQEHRRLGGNPALLTVVHVPGSFELPVAALRLARGGKHDAVVCLGCIVRGETSHYDHVAAQAAGGIAKVALETGVPTIFGVITAENLEQAIDRAGGKQGNHGAKAMHTAVEMANLFRQM